MTEPVVLHERVDDHVALVTINRPDARNAINPDVAARLDAIVAELEADGVIRAVVLQGAGDQAFSAGADLKAAIENGVSQVEHRAGRFPQVSGLTAIVDRSRPAGDRVVAMTVGGAPLDPEKLYRVATNDFMLKGGDGYGMLGARVEDADLKGKLVASDVMVHARRLGTIPATTGGRIRFL